jgi:predicted pyridoxine 5'-phosphate oxidase superfamily flavin-nucleotide-binding protein
MKADGMTGGAWHAGEQTLQAEAGVAPRLAEAGPRLLRDQMPEQHRLFFAELPLLFTGILDGEGQPWASLLSGPPGFAASPAPRELHIAARPLAGDPAAASWQEEGAPVGLLGLQAETGRRNRLNGWIESPTRDGFTVRVGQSFGNCPRYIHPRQAVHEPSPGDAQVFASDTLDDAAARIVAQADTFFIASAHPDAARAEDAAQGVDLSHRGGPAGFVRLQADGSLIAPDYAGNFFFNTLGNLRLQPRCGLLFLDFERGERLHLACRAQLLPPDARQWPQAQRLLRFEIGRVVRVRGGMPLHWTQPTR